MPYCRECGAEISTENIDPFFDPVREQIIVIDDHRQLSPVQWSLLMVLRARLGRTVSRDFLFRQIYGQGDWPGTGNAMNVFIHRLRQKLKGTPYRIVTQPRRGFRLEKFENGEVNETTGSC